MKQSIKKLVILFLVAALSLGIVACGPTTPGVGQDTKPLAPIKEVKFPLEEEVTLTFMVVNYSGYDIAAELEKNELWQELYEQTHVKVEIVPLPASDTMTAINAKFMSHSEADMMLCPPALVSATDFSKMVEDGLVMDISRYIDKAELMPNLNARVFGDNANIRKMINSANGGAYYLPSSISSIHTKLESPFYINKTWLDKMAKAANNNTGIKSVEDITDIDKLQTVLQYFKSNDMNGNGDKNDEIPYLVWDQDNNSHLDAFLSLYGVATKWNNASMAEDGIYIKDGDVNFAYTSDNYKEAIWELNEWYKQGLIYDQAFAADNAYNSLQKSNRIGLSSRPIPGGATKDEWVPLKPIDAYGFGASFFVNPAAIAPTRLAAITRSCEEPEIALAWLDLFYSFETSVRVQYGEEEDGRYTWTEDGKLKTIILDDNTEEKLQEEQPTLTNMFQMLTNFNSDDYTKRIVANKNDIKKMEAYEMYKAAGALNDEIWPRPAMDSETAEGINELKQDIFNTMSSQRAKWVTNKSLTKAQFETEWNAYVDTMKNQLHIDRYVDLHQDAYDAFQAQFGN